MKTCLKSSLADPHSPTKPLGRSLPSSADYFTHTAHCLAATIGQQLQTFRNFSLFDLLLKFGFANGPWFYGGSALRVSHWITWSAFRASSTESLLRSPHIMAIETADCSSFDCFSSAICFAWASWWAPHPLHNLHDSRQCFLKISKALSLLTAELLNLGDLWHRSVRKKKQPHGQQAGCIPRHQHKVHPYDMTKPLHLKHQVTSHLERKYFRLTP